MKKNFSLLVLLVIVVFAGCSTARRGGYYGGTDPSIGIGIGAGLAALAVGGAFSTHEKEETKRELIRANTALAAACSLGPDGEVTYNSPKGDSKITTKKTMSTEDCRKLIEAQKQRIYYERYDYAYESYSPCSAFPRGSDAYLGCRRARGEW